MIIAESGTAWAHLNPNDRISSVLSHAKAAANAGADVFKVQMFVPDEELFCPVEGDDKRWNWWRNTFLSLDDWRRVKWHCEAKLGVTFMASAFQVTAVEWLNELGVKYHKVASRAAATYPAKLANAPLIVSNGFGLRVPFGAHYALWCVSKYPTPLDEARWDDDYDGISDHSGTVWPAIEALSRGAGIVEVHFVVGEDTGPDAKVSLTVEQLGMICEARDAFKEMGCLSQ